MMAPRERHGDESRTVLFKSSRSEITEHLEAGLQDPWEQGLTYTHTQTLLYFTPSLNGIMFSTKRSEKSALQFHQAAWKGTYMAKRVGKLFLSAHQGQLQTANHLYCKWSNS